MPPKKKGTKGPKSELAKTLEAFDSEEFDDLSAANVTVKDSLSTISAIPYQYKLELLQFSHSNI